MSRIIVELDQPWSGPTPQLAWIVGIAPTPGGGQGIGFSTTAGRSVTGTSIDMKAELSKGAGNKPMKEQKGSNREPPSALSLCPTGDMMLGVVLDAKLGAKFDTLPFSGGYTGAGNDMLGVVRVSDTAAYMVVPASKFGTSYVKAFNIHLVVAGKYTDGQATVTRIILDPDMRLPPPGSTPP